MDDYEPTQATRLIENLFRMISQIGLYVYPEDDFGNQNHPSINKQLLKHSTNVSLELPN